MIIIMGDSKPRVSIYTKGLFSTDIDLIFKLFDPLNICYYML